MSIKDAIILQCEKVSFNVPMKKHTTFRIGGECDIFCEPKNAYELAGLIRLLNENNQSYIVFGNGSNVLVSDEGIRGVVIKIGEQMSEVSVCGEEITSGAGILLSRLSKKAMNESLSGMECISGIPGSVGGAVYMNAGAYGAEIADILQSLTYVSREGEIITLEKADLSLGYRKSVFMENGGIVTSCVLKLKKGDKEKIAQDMAEVTKKRVEKQPLELPSAGSTFKRPQGYFAGALIEECGLKGYSVGGAKVSEKHAGFVVNFDNATANDVLAVIEHVQKTVYEKFGVGLEPEVKFIGIN